MKVPCAICGRDRDKDSCTPISPTKEERLLLAKLGEKAPDTYYYCKPCMRVMQNPATAVELMRGVVHARARQLGAVNADEVADRFKNRLLSKSRLKPAS